LLSLAVIEPGSAWCAEIDPVRFDTAGQDLESRWMLSAVSLASLAIYDGRMVAHQSSSTAAALGE
jgi:hypothetical protein